MKENKSKFEYPLILIFTFVLLAQETKSQWKTIQCSSFSLRSYGEDSTDKRNYLELIDGTKVYGQEISWQRGLGKNEVKIDDKRYDFKDVRGYFKKGRVSLRIGNDFAIRFILGKLSVYFLETFQPSFERGSQTRMVCDIYVQGKSGLDRVVDKEDIMDWVKDCPKSAAMINKTNKEIKEAIRKNNDYLNQIFIIYNNDCR